MTEAVIEARGLTRDFGQGRGVFDLDLDVRRGEVFGFLGPNGAGKSTTIRMLLDLLRPTRGEVRILGMDPRRDGVRLRRHVGHLPGELALRDGLTGQTILSDLARLRGGVDEDRLHALVERLGAELDEPLRRLSKGNRQKIGVVQALMHDPDVLILDEPTDGLDPLLRREVHDLLLEARDRGATVFLSSHIIHEVEQVCDRVAILRRGRLRVVSRLDDLRRREGHRVRVRFAAPVDGRPFLQVPGVERVERRADGMFRFTLGADAAMDGLVKVLSRHPVASLETEHEDLEAAFMALYGGPGEDDARGGGGGA